MKVSLTLPKDYAPLRRVSGFQPHLIGGVGTPWRVKKSDLYYVEVACFAHGCNLRCPQCQNYTVTYDNITPALKPVDAAEILTAQRDRYGVDRMAISGGEPTLNRAWLTRFFQELRRLNSDDHARLHLDTNATVLTPDYLDRLVEAGVTDIGPDLKGLRPATFTKITGIADRELAERYVKNAWEVTKYIIDKYYPESLFVGVGIPYNRYLITLEEIREMGEKIVDIDPEVQVCLLDYFPTFRRFDMERPSVAEMRIARETLMETGLKTVLAQTVIGHLGP
jgi:pyruvate formate lyase activating enzyme